MSVKLIIGACMHTNDVNSSLGSVSAMPSLSTVEGVNQNYNNIPLLERMTSHLEGCMFRKKIQLFHHSLVFSKIVKLSIYQKHRFASTS